MMLVHKAYKFRIYPNEEQKVLIIKTIGCSRFVFNHFLSAWNNACEVPGLKVVRVTNFNSVRVTKVK